MAANPWVDLRGHRTAKLADSSQRPQMWWRRLEWVVPDTVTTSEDPTASAES